MSWQTALLRETYRRELFPPRVLWWMAAEGMRDFARTVARGLATPLGGDEARARSLFAELSARMFERRYAALSAHPRFGSKLPSRDADPRALARTMGALYRVSTAPKSAWLFDGCGGAPTTVRERLTAARILHVMTARERWEEVATHLGELLIVLTEELPKHVPHAQKTLGDICFASGVAFAARAKKVFSIPDDVPDPPRAAMEVLRMSEYVFRVNPEHWSDSDGSSGSLEGTACPWYTRPGWERVHCGIFGQFQAGVSSVFGLRYQLTKTIPKHGGHTCKIDLKPIQIGRKPVATA
jgi:hypothetical protein